MVKAPLSLEASMDTVDLSGAVCIGSQICGRKEETESGVLGCKQLAASQASATANFQPHWYSKAAL